MNGGGGGGGGGGACAEDQNPARRSAQRVLGRSPSRQPISCSLEPFVASPVYFPNKYKAMIITGTHEHNNNANLKIPTQFTLLIVYSFY